ncbi:acetylserotonin O-methyltransferase [Parasphingopyxis algicola]|uniref:acetylserotonin O-methyltransferase n=1 Tax=Parasphingopyxis algicola TaxID=2026624 RepID=UPI001FECC795|nr:acetylserotonin O-methyltransferase [Parasphingopyxis algicola]
MFDLVAGFAYSQTLYAFVESGLLDLMTAGPRTKTDITSHVGLSLEATERLLRAAASLKLAEPLGDGWWALGAEGAALSGNAGAIAMIRHHHLLYTDLVDPLGLLRKDRAEDGALSRYWSYAGSPDAAHADAEAVSPYSALMAASQPMVAEQILTGYRFSQYERLLDIGGGDGAFLGALAEAAPELALGLFDLPAVAERARLRLGAAGHAARTAFHPGDFTSDPLPTDYDIVTLVRILHDHDDDAVARLLASIRAALPPGGTLLIAEPMAGTPGAEAMGDAYFGLYLWAMRSGRPRRPEEIGAMLSDAGFSSWRLVRTRQPLIARIIVAAA